MGQVQHHINPMMHFIVFGSQLLEAVIQQLQKKSIHGLLLVATHETLTLTFAFIMMAEFSSSHT